MLIARVELATFSLQNWCSTSWAKSAKILALEVEKTKNSGKFYNEVIYYHVQYWFNSCSTQKKSCCRSIVKISSVKPAKPPTDRRGFEPLNDLRHYWFSGPAPSTTRSTIQISASPEDDTGCWTDSEPVAEVVASGIIRFLPLPCFLTSQRQSGHRVSNDGTTTEPPWSALTRDSWSLHYLIFCHWTNVTRNGMAF